MKHYKSFIFAMALMMLGILAVGITVINRHDGQGTDVVILNDIAQTAKNHLGEPENLRNFDFGADYLVLDARNNVVFSTVSTEIMCIEDAVKRHCPYIIINDEERYLGCAILLSSMDEAYEKQRKTAICVVAVSEALVLLCLIFWGIYVRRSVVQPFKKMEKFAGEIAKGNLKIPLEMDSDNMFGIFTESFDVMREELSASRDRELQLKLREKELIASLSHDLKTPVTGIKLTAELMLAQTTEPSNTEKLGNIYKKAEQINSLVNDLFTSTLKDLGEMNVTASDEDSAILHEFVRRCDDKGLAQETEIPECIIKIDSRRMEQVVSNIISNSYKYAGTPIDISYEIADKCLKMCIRDYGDGVAEDELMLVTNKFYRSKSSKESKIEGSGLGLYIAKMLMENMGGELRCLNAENGFEVQLFIQLS